MGQVRDFVRNGWLYDTNRVRVATAQCVMENTKGEKVTGETWLQYDDL